MKEMIERLLSGATLTETEARGLFEAMLTGQMDSAQIAAVLVLIQRRGATVDEIVGAARVMREHVTRIPVATGSGRVVLDTCGTGGAPKTFNVSTVAAVCAAAAAPGRVLVAKHGNRSRTGRGSAEVLSMLGVQIDAGPEVQAACLEKSGVCFCFAIHHHPAMKHAGPTRRSLGIPTIFNLLGPLTNPAGARHQLIGVYDRSLVEPVAKALVRLGAERARVVHGAGGLDEVSIAGPTVCALVEGGAVRMEEIDPAASGVSGAPIDAIVARDLEDAAAMARSVFAGETSPAREIVLLNTGVALEVAGAARSIAEGARMAAEAIDSGAAAATLARLCDVSHGRS